MIEGRSTLLVTALGFLLGSIGGCGSSDGKKTVELMSQRNTNVTTEEIKTSTYSLYLNQPGTTYAIRNVDLESRVTGYIESIDFEDGQLVKTGDRLFLIDPRPFEAALLQARGNLEAALAQRNLDERNVQRNRSLVESGAISREAFDTFVTNLEVAEGNVETAAGDLVNAELNLSFTSIIAPFNGKLGQRQYEIGALVEQGASQTLVTIVEYDPMRILVSVAAEHLPLLRKLKAEGNLNADVRVNGTRGGGGRVFKGTVDFIDNQVAELTSTVLVRIRFPNPDGWAFPGQYGESQILIKEEPNAIVIPQKAVSLLQGGMHSVWVVGEKNEVQSQVVELGDTNNGECWITKGLKVGQKIVVDTSGQLASGDTVTIVSASKFEQQKKAKKSGMTGSAPAAKKDSTTPEKSKTTTSSTRD